MLQRIFTPLILLCLSLPFSAFAAEPFALKEGDKVCFIGNSITHGGSYHTFLQVYYATRHPEVNFEFHNCGISGDHASGMLRRLEEDVLVHKPDYAFLMTGMNDIMSYLYEQKDPDTSILTKRQEALDTYYANTEKLANQLIENGIKPIFMTPTIYDQTAEMKAVNKFGINDALSECAIHIRQLAAKHNAPCVDLYTLLNKITKEEQAKDPTFTIIGPDRVHPKDPGHLVMAFEIIKTLFPVSPISIIELNAKKKTVNKEENCTVNLHRKAKPLEFQVQAKSLPFPVKESLIPTLKLIPYFSDYMQEILLITSLKTGNYQLMIDEVEVGIFDHEALSRGINLAEYPITPQYQQALKVLEISMQYKARYNDLRVLYMIEFKNLKDYKGNGSIEDVTKYLKAKVETQKGKSWYPYMVKTTNAYLENISKKETYKEDLIKIRKELFEENSPKLYTYKLIKLK